jgi:hypothetical protein
MQGASVDLECAQDWKAAGSDGSSISEVISVDLWM